jgi:hypothetical protein
MLPVLVATAGYLAQALLPNCQPQMYGVGECFVGTVNLAPAILLAVGMGVYIAVAGLIFIAAPLMVLAWWLDSRRGNDAV